jgi:transketolase
MMRQALSDSLLSAAKNNYKVILLTGDHGYGLFYEFRKHFPSQFINAGIAEQNMLGMAAGLARAGYFPIVYGLSSFVPIRVLEQIKLDVCHDNLPVIFLGDGAGFVYSFLGTSHQSTEDISATRAIPNLSIYSPADRFEMSSVMDLALELRSPCYIRIGKSDVGDVHSQSLNLSKDDIPACSISDSSISFIGTGSMVKMATQLADEFRASVYSAPIIKPFNKQRFLELILNSQALITFEEHSVYGGLGGMIAEIISENCPKKLLRIGVEDRFSRYCGSYQYLLKEHGLDIDSVRLKITNFLNINHNQY